MWLNQTSTYNSASESVKKADEFLQSELAELKKEIETNELVHGIAFVRPFTSVPVPKDAQVLARERRLYIEKLLKVHDIRKPYIQADVMNEQIENCTREEYTNESLPLLLHQVNFSFLFFFELNSLGYMRHNCKSLRVDSELEDFYGFIHPKGF